MDGYDPGNDYRAWERATIRSRSKLIGLADDPITGQPVEVYGFMDDEFEGTKLTVEDDIWYRRRLDRWP